MTAWYNENDNAAADILETLMGLNVIAPGVVDRRSIVDVQPADLVGFTQHHFFAGGGLWSVAARLAGWPDERPVWTASCPCQPFSQMGRRGGINDSRHLWPHLFRLWSAFRPSVGFGEQVTGPSGRAWFDGICSDLEGINVAARAFDIPACSVNAPHERNRLYWCAVDEKRCALDNAGRAGLEGLGRHGSGPAGRAISHRSTSSANVRGGVSSDASGFIGWQGNESIWQQSDNGFDSRISSGFDPWAGSEWIECHDQKARRCKPGIRFLADGIPGRLDLWRVAGNAIVPALAAEVIGAFMDVYG